MAAILLQVAMGLLVSSPSSSPSSRLRGLHHGRGRVVIRMEFGDRYYVSHDAPAPYGPASGDATLPKGVFECSLKRPLGIQFEEQDARGVQVLSLISGGNAERSKKIQAGDSLVGVTAVRAARSRVWRPHARISSATRLTRAHVCVHAPAQVRLMGAKFERQMFDCRRWSIDTVVDAIGSNDPERFGCEDVVLQFIRNSDELEPQAVAGRAGS